MPICSSIPFLLQRNQYFVLVAPNISPFIFHLSSNYSSLLRFRKTSLSLSTTTLRRFCAYGLNSLLRCFIFSKLHCPMVRIKFSLDIHPSKTTSYFLKNDRSFLVKRRVVFHKRFDAAKRPKAHRKTHIGNRLSYTKNRICEKSYNRHSTRAYVRAHNRSFLFFAVTSVTLLFISSYIPNDYVLTANKF